MSGTHDSSKPHPSSLFDRLVSGAQDRWNSVTMQGTVEADGDHYIISPDPQTGDDVFRVEQKHVEVTEIRKVPSQDGSRQVSLCRIRIQRNVPVVRMRVTHSNLLGARGESNPAGGRLSEKIVKLEVQLADHKALTKTFASLLGGAIVAIFIENVWVGDKTDAKVEATAARFRDEVQRTGARFENALAKSDQDLKEIQKNLALVDPALTKNRQLLEDTARLADATRYELAHARIVGRVENALGELLMIDQLRFHGFSNARILIDKSIEDLQKALRDKPQSHEGEYIHFLRGLQRYIAASAGDLTDARLLEIEKEFDSVTRPEDQTANYWYCVASLRGRLGRQKEAEDALRLALEVSGGLSPVLNARIAYGNVSMRLLRAIDAKTVEKERASIDREFDRILNESPPFWPARLYYAAFYLHLKDAEKALQQLTMAVDGGGATIDKVIEVVSHDLETPKERAFFQPLLEERVTGKEGWEPYLRKELEARRQKRRTANSAQMSPAT
jgi:tetratricopeptide (TPR) repeat protein